MSEHFPIQIDVEDTHLGSILRTLSRLPGVLTIHLPMPGQTGLAAPKAGKLPSLPKAPAKTMPREAAVGSAMPVRTILAKTMGMGAVHQNILREALARSGKSEYSMSSALMNMVKDKTVKRVGVGTYALTSKGQRLYIEQAPRQYTNNASLRQTVLEALSSGRKSHVELRDHIVDRDFSANNMYGSVVKMREEGLIRRIDDDYEITEAGLKALGVDTVAQPAQVIDASQDRADGPNYYMTMDEGDAA